APTRRSWRTVRWSARSWTPRPRPLRTAVTSRSSTCARGHRWTWARGRGRAVLRAEAPGNLGLGSEIAARVTEECFYSLEAPVLRVTGYNVPYPAARIEEDFLPDLDRVLDAVDRTYGWGRRCRGSRGSQIGRAAGGGRV